jgi:hypothetical protein
MGCKSVLFFASFLAIPLACQSFLDALLFAGLQVEGVTLDFLDDVFLLYLALKPTQCIFKRFAFLYANFCQLNYTPKPALIRQHPEYQAFCCYGTRFLSAK